RLAARLIVAGQAKRANGDGGDGGIATSAGQSSTDRASGGGAAARRADPCSGAAAADPGAASRASGGARGPVAAQGEVAAWGLATARRELPAVTCGASSGAWDPAPLLPRPGVQRRPGSRQREARRRRRQRQLRCSHARRFHGVLVTHPSPSSSAGAAAARPDSGTHAPILASPLIHWPGSCKRFRIRFS
ncbi:unnamed protein product, partial [Urochloa humidicola]